MTTEVIDNGHALHLVGEVRTLCGKPVADRDRYEDGAAGWRVWERQEDRRCGRCCRAYGRRVAASVLLDHLTAALAA